MKWLHITLETKHRLFKNVITQTPDRATSNTSGSSVNSKDNGPNPMNKEAASAKPVTPPTYVQKGITSDLPKKGKGEISVAFLNFSKKCLLNLQDFV